MDDPTSNRHPRAPFSTPEGSWNHRDVLVRDYRAAVVIPPGEVERAALFDLGGELEVGIRCDRGVEVAAKHRPSVELARERIDDLARDDVAVLVPAQAIFHDVGNQRLDLNDLSPSGLLRHPDARSLDHGFS